MATRTRRSSTSIYGNGSALQDQPKWLASGWGHKPRSIDDLILAISRIGFLQLGRRYVWRGVRDWRWPIQSSLQRYALGQMPGFDVRSEVSLRELETSIIAHARYWRLDQAGNLSDQALLALLQHHGSPTRLLDVSRDPMTALWFACDKVGSGRDASGALFAFDVSEMDCLETSVANLRPTWGSLEAPNSWHYAHELETAAKRNRPFIVEPSERDARMIAQQALFIAGVAPGSPAIPGLDAFAFDVGSAPEGKLESILSAAPRGRGRASSPPIRDPADCFQLKGQTPSAHRDDLLERPA